MDLEGNHRYFVGAPPAGLRILEAKNKSATELEVRQEDIGYLDDQNLVDTWQSWSRVVVQLVDYVGCTADILHGDL